MNRCGCNPIQEQIEYEIPQVIKSSNPYEIADLIFPNDLEELKCKIIFEYNEILNKLECGIQEDLEFLLEEISLVEIIENE